MRVFDGIQNTQDVNSLTKAGVIFVVSLFTVILMYFVLSAPVNAMYDGFDSADWGLAESQHSWYMDFIRAATTLFFAILVTIPVAWFFFWVFHREPAYGYNMNDMRQWRQ